MTSVYLDNSATTKPFEETIAAVTYHSIESFYNPSSLYLPAVNAYRELKEARKTVARAFGCQEGEVVFTSGGTECNNLALFGCINAHRGTHMITTVTEHPSVLRGVAYLEQKGYTITKLNVDNNGYINFSALEEAIAENTALVSVLHVNNETGAIQDIPKIAQIIHAKNPNAHFHVDGVQAFLKMDTVNIPPGIDFYSTSAHKIHGPKGVGALFVRKGMRMAGVQLGGGQEMGYRSGTENLPGICGFAQAVARYTKNHSEYISQLRKMKETIAKRLLSVEDAFLNGPPINETAPHIFNISFEGVPAEVLLHTLEGDGIYIGLGSACSSQKGKYSPVLTAMGLSKKRLESAVRMSLSPLNTLDEMDIASEKIMAAVQSLRKYKRR